MRFTLALFALAVLTAGFCFAVQGHPAKPSPTPAAKPYLKSVWYLDGNQHVLQELSIESSGAVYTARNVEDFAIQASHWSHLSKADFASVKTQAGAMPKSEEMPLLRDRVVVYLAKDKTPRYYRLSKMPPVLREIYRITKARLP
jgi:hypothetical protein